jgi:hypothetical protein
MGWSWSVPPLVSFSPSLLSRPTPPCSKVLLILLDLNLLFHSLRSKLKLIPDRSNGFEKKYFQHQNTVARRTYQADQMGM